MPLKAAASKLEPSSQSPHMPALPSESKIQGIPGVLVGRAAPLHFIGMSIYHDGTNHKQTSMLL